MANIVTIDCNTKTLLVKSACAFGVFDGVHRGHQFLIKKARDSAATCEGPCIALTFSIDPDEVFAADRLVKLMTNEERIAALAASGVDAVGVLTFNREFAMLSPEEFLESTFGAGVPAHLHIGKGFRFGCKAAGDATFLEEWGSRRGMQVHCHDLYQIDSLPVSSTRIRELLAAGDVGGAEKLLGRKLNIHR